MLSIRKSRLVEHDMMGDEIKAAITVSFVMSGITQEDTQGRTRRQFMGSGGRQVGVTLAAGNVELVIGGRSAEEGSVRRARLEHFGGQDVE